MHRKITIMPNDTVIFSSNPIPGNEKAVSRVINELSAKGANVIFQDAHVSGHACQEELKLIYSLVKPKYAVPVHGEYRHLKGECQTWLNRLAFRRRISLCCSPVMCWKISEEECEGCR